jgi:hypothetical protein
MRIAPSAPFFALAVWKRLTHGTFGVDGHAAAALTTGLAPRRVAVRRGHGRCPADQRTRSGGNPADLWADLRAEFCRDSRAGRCSATFSAERGGSPYGVTGSAGGAPGQPCGSIRCSLREVSNWPGRGRGREAGYAGGSAGDRGGYAGHRVGGPRRPCCCALSFVAVGCPGCGRARAGRRYDLSGGPSVRGPAAEQRSRRRRHRAADARDLVPDGPRTTDRPPRVCRDSCRRDIHWRSGRCFAVRPASGPCCHRSDDDLAGADCAHPPSAGSGLTHSQRASRCRRFRRVAGCHGGRR